MEGRGRPRGAPGRVADAQRQARPTLLLAGAFLVAAAAGTAVPHWTGRWLSLHLALAGALVLAISGATQFLAVTWGAAPPPVRAVSVTQRWLVTGGAVLVVAGRQGSWSWVVAVGAVSTVAGLVTLAVILCAIARRAVQPRVRPAITAYLVGIATGVVGVVLGGVLGSGGGGDLAGRLRDVHETLNLLGLAGFVVAGTLPFFVATEAKVKMSRRATHAAQWGIQSLMAAGLAVATIGLVGRWRVAAAAGFVGYAAALLCLLALMPRVRGKQLRWAGPRLVQTGAAITWWVGSVVYAGARAGRGLPPFAGGVVPALVVGGYVQLIVGSLSYFGPVLVGGGHEQLAASFRITRSWLGLVSGNVAVVAATVGGLRVVYGVALAAWALDGAVRAVLLVVARRRLTQTPPANAA
ncbi:MAG TPA: hypothetical protein VHC63_00950 [Acidimicrobiales bacterium]|nr:hypothetical protein [Acidimicrobiales bacterium]